MDVFAENYVATYLVTQDLPECKNIDLVNCIQQFTLKIEHEEDMAFILAQQTAAELESGSNVGLAVGLAVGLTGMAWN
jgi:hypothetical protein